MFYSSKSISYLSQRSPCYSRTIANWFTIIVVTFSIPFHSLAQAQQQPAAKQPATDSLGDPLPEHALLRIGTTRFHSPSGVNDMALSPAGDIVVTVGSELVVWDAKTGKELFKASSQECGLDNRGPGYGLESV